MYLKSIMREVLFEGRFHTVKKAIEVAVKEGVCLDRVDLRHAHLTEVNLDGAVMNGACLWGANLTRANMSGVLLKDADCRNANFQDSCLAEANCAGINFSGSYFSRTILLGADLSNTQFSCPSLFSLNLNEAKTLKDAIYSHKGEVDCDLSDHPIVIKGLPKNIILMKDKVMIGTSLYDAALQDKIFTTFSNVINHENLLQMKGLETDICKTQKRLAKR